MSRRLITATGAQNVVKEPDTVCVTYLSTYLVPVLSNATSSVPTDDANNTSRTLDDSLTASATFESDTDPSLDLTETFHPSQSLSDDSNELMTTLLTTNTGPADSDPTTAPSPDQLVVFRIVPDTDNSKLRRLKRALGGFVGSTSEICQDASAFSLSDGRLLDDGKPIYYNGEDFKELRGQQATPPLGSVDTTFAADGGFLRFRSPDLPKGEAGFCQSPGTGQVSTTWLRLSQAISCWSAVPTSTDLQTLQSTVNSMATSTPFRTAIASVPEKFLRLHFAHVTSLILPSLEPTQTPPAQTSSFRFSNTSTNAFPTVPIETSEDLTFTNIPGVTFAPSDEATTANVLPTSVLSSEPQLTTEDATSSFPEATTLMNYSDS
ncbi:uncharacterized protein FFUJ_10834 [Fusarium fujikuroi IMI 58289]|uniref:DUF7908 domain-containing protein n=1 Tax=Gibberella fujikuroi (strain CBS 195.34 / IMI 58289 / NRRL A-6831) TaxID=1279085 RepID=S0EKN2_GIBF5|nr:LOW QUALITY PROTEIN: uncharacterized protein FFUJ_10834 [Fusarium fujikuroi IMI 58289]CCT75155.1 uncharacterized protein FFUJ_10834 [Fusarium fujikuroi IMI 58289]